MASPSRQRSVVPVGPDELVDDRAVIITPTRPGLTATRTSSSPNDPGCRRLAQLSSSSQVPTAGPPDRHWLNPGAIVTVDLGQTLAYPLPAPNRAFVYLLAGSLRVAGRLVTERQVGLVRPLPDHVADPLADPLADTAGSTLSITATEGDVPAVAMIYSGEPIASTSRREGSS